MRTLSSNKKMDLVPFNSFVMDFPLHMYSIRFKINIRFLVLS